MTPPWMLIAERELGIKEVPGLGLNNPRILEYFTATSYDAPNDETPWCSAFVNWCMREASIVRTRSARARSWLGWGQKLDVPIFGCVVVYKRGNNPSQGHVNFFLEMEGLLVRGRGGNQGNAVSDRLYSVESVLDYRWPIGYPMA
jgi:uncharacterized protein (TIGR02594 family)